MPAEYLTVNDITSRGTVVYTTGVGSGSAKWGSNVLNLEVDAPYLTAHDASGNYLFASTYAASYTCTEIVTSTTRIFGVGGDRVKAFDLSGNTQWLVDASGAKTIAWDSSVSTLYVAGTFTGSVTLSGTTLTSTGSDAYLARYDSAGALLGAVNVSSALQSALNSLVVVPSAIHRVGAVTYIAGTYGGALAFSGTTTTADASYKAGFILAVDAANAVQWVKTIDAQYLDNIYDIDIQGTTVYAAGSYGQRTGSLELNNTIALPGKVNNSAEGYIAALDLNGAYLWVQKVGANIAGGELNAEQSSVRSIVATAANNIYFTGNFKTNPVFLGSDLSLNFANTTRQGFVGYMNATVTSPPAPGAPLDVSASSPAISTVRVTYSKNYDAGPTDFYRVYYKQATSGSYTNYVDSSAATVDISGLTGVLHNFKVVAVGPTGSTSPDSAVVTIEPASGAPSAPIDASYSTVTSSSVTITWQENPASVSAAVTYRVYYKLASSINWAGFVTVNAPTTTATVSGLLSNYDYRFAVEARNNNGESPYSSILDVRTLLGAPNGVIGTIAYNTVTVLWNPIGNVSGYRVFYARRAGFDASAPVWDASLNVVNVYADIAGLLAFTEYAFAVAAVSSGTVGELSTIIYRTTQGIPPTPSKPRNLAITAGNQQVSLRWQFPWEPPAFMSIVTGYRVYKKAAGDAEYSLVETIGAQLNYIVTDLSNGVNYSFYVAAYNGAGNGTSSDIVSATPFNPSVPVVEPVASPVLTPGAGSLLAYAAALPGTDSEDEAAYNTGLDAVIASGTSSSYSDTANNITVGLMPVADIQEKKASAPASVLLETESTKVTNIVPPVDVSLIAVTIKPAEPTLLPAGSSIVFNPDTDVEIKITKYDGLKNVIPSVIDNPSTYVTVQIKRNYEVINIYKYIDGVYTRLMVLSGLTTVPVAGIRGTSGRCVGGNHNTGFTYEFTVPFTSVFATNGTQSSVDTTPVPCLVKGTRLLTPKGYVAVEDLYEGDEVMTSAGRAVKIVKAYESVVESCSTVNGAWTIPRNFFGAAAGPSKAFQVSPNHAVSVPGTAMWFIPAYATKEQKARMKQAAAGSRMEYFHIELPNYLEDNMVLEGGAVVESYGDNWTKKNAAYVAKMKAVYTWSTKAKYFTRIGSPTAAAVASKGTKGSKATKGSKGSKGKK